MIASHIISHFVVYILKEARVARQIIHATFVLNTPLYASVDLELNESVHAENEEGLLSQNIFIKWLVIRILSPLSHSTPLGRY